MSAALCAADHAYTDMEVVKKFPFCLHLRWVHLHLHRILAFEFRLASALHPLSIVV